MTIDPAATPTPEPAAAPAPAPAPAPQPAPSPEPAPAATPAPAAAPAGEPAPAPTPEPKPGEEDLLFGKKPDAPKVSLEDMKKALTEKAPDQKLDGKTDAEIEQMFKDQQAKDAAATSYTDFTVPEEMPVDEVMVNEYKEFAKANNLTQEQAQAGIDLYVKAQKAGEQQWNDLKKSWREETVNDPDIGGANLGKTTEAINDMVRKYTDGPEHLEQMQNHLILLGLGNNRHFLKFMNNIASRTGEDDAGGAGSGASTNTEKLPPERVLFPNMKQ